MNTKPKAGNKKSDKTFKPKPRVEDDGVKHINVYVNGKTELGKQLASFADVSFVHPYFGPFNCMEGFWQFIACEERDDAFRDMTGPKAKKYGANVTKKLFPEFREVINAANFFKIEQNPELKKMFIESTLPFEQYWLFEDHKMVIELKAYEWIIRGFEKSRELMKAGLRPDEINYESI